MKEWNNPVIKELNFMDTKETSDYITVCNWDGAETLGLGNEDYTNPNVQPASHADWVWCKVHGRWHPHVNTPQKS